MEEYNLPAEDVLPPGLTRDQYLAKYETMLKGEICFAAEDRLIRQYCTVLNIPPTIASLLRARAACSSAIQNLVDEAERPLTIAVVGETSQKILALYDEQDVASSAMPASSCKKSLAKAMAVIEEMIVDGLLIDGTTLWCFSVNELMNPDSRELFFAIPRNTARKSWLEWRFQKQ